MQILDGQCGHQGGLIAEGFLPRDASSAASTLPQWPRGGLKMAAKPRRGIPSLSRLSVATHLKWDIPCLRASPLSFQRAALLALIPSPSIA